MRHLLLRSATLAIALAAPLVAFGQSPAGTDLFDGFDASGFSEAGGLYYRENAEQTAGTVEFQQETVLNGPGALKLSVRQMCPANAEGCSERAEIWEKTELRVPYDEGVWYGFALKFDDPPPSDDHRYVMAQWKREIGPEADGDFSPFLALRLKSGRMFFTAETNYHAPPEGAPEAVAGQCPEGYTPVWLRPETNQMRLLVASDAEWSEADGAEFTRCTDNPRVTQRGGALPVPGSGWIDFAIYSLPGPEGDGRIEIFANGDWLVTIEGRIGHGDPGLEENQYFKFGPYRDAREGNWTLYYDDFRRSARCETVLKDAAACAALP